MNIATETPFETKQLNIEALHQFVDRETRRITEMRQNITARIANNWNMLTTLEVADFTEIVGIQGALASLIQLMSWAGREDITNEKIRDEWERMAEAKLRRFNFVPSNSSQAFNLTRGYEGAFWARAIDELQFVR